MDRVFEAGAAAGAPSAPASPSTGYPTSGDPGNGIPATTPGPWWFHMITEELRAVIVAAGMTPDHESLDQLAEAVGSLGGVSVRGVASQLTASASGTNANVQVTAEQIVVADAAGKIRGVSAVNVTIDTSAAGLNGLDTGALAGSTWYAVFVIFNPSTDAVAGLVSLSASAPTLPVGYTHFARIGWVRTDATANKYPLAFRQAGRTCRYVTAAATNVTKLPTMASGVQGSQPSTFAAVAVGAFVPATAKSISVFAVDTAAAASALVVVAPNASYRYAYGAGVGGNPAPMQSNGSGYSVGLAVNGDVLLESTNIYTILGGSGCVLNCLGWEDSL